MNIGNVFLEIPVPTNLLPAPTQCGVASITPPDII
jgi:hypothetical protein